MEGEKTDITSEQRAAFLALFEENTTPLTAYLLSAVQGRRDFLFRFSEKDEEAIFEAVQAVWAQLNDPKSFRCTKMAKAAGLQGGGKRALRAVLMAFLHDFNSIEVTPLVNRADYATMEEWQAAFLSDFAKGDAAMVAVLDKWEPILNGQSADVRPRSKSTALLNGPSRLASNKRAGLLPRNYSGSDGASNWLRLTKLPA
jgi:hypothetical protein